ncbi:MAG: hydroxylamine reductase, partial [bacterium]
MSMFCYQCQEAAKGVACTIKGVCGKTDTVANLQDLLVYVTKGVSWLAKIANENGMDTAKEDKYVFEALFVTITNGNFDENAIINKIKESYPIREKLMNELVKKELIKDPVPACVIWNEEDRETIIKKSKDVGVLNIENEDIRSLKELLTYGLKGIAAYGDHALVLGYRDKDVFRFTHKALSATLDNEISADELTNMVIECGKHGVKVMALLDKANTETYGNPEITRVNIGVRDNPAILISGHDLKDMEELLKQTDGTGVDVYTHSEMLPANYYPAFKKYDHFVGNYGNSWWKQDKEFESFNGPILMTTNCITPVKDSYKDRIFTTGMAGYPEVTHIPE